MCDIDQQDSGLGTPPLARGSFFSPQQAWGLPCFEQVYSGSPGMLLPSAGMEPSPTTGIHLLNGLSAVPPLFVGQSAHTLGQAMLQPPLASQVNMPPLHEAADAGMTEGHNAGCAGPPRRHGSAKLVASAHGDGYAWRKYGEKVVKGSPNPRSYYKCSHAACSAKKIVERNEAGDILATDYKGDHNHAAPTGKQASRFKPSKSRAMAPVEAPSMDVDPMLSLAPALSTADMLAGLQQHHMLTGAGLRHLALASLPMPGGMLSLQEGLMASATGGNAVDDEDDEATEDSDELMQSKIAGQIAAGGKDGKADFDIAHTISGMKDPMPLAAHAAARLSALVEAASSAEKELTNSHSSPSSGPSAKRLKMEPPTTTGRSERMCMEEEVGDIDDDDAPHEGSRQRIVSGDNIADGFKWRKYGQKTVKGSPHPRSYYKCTFPNCHVRKHVEKRQGDDDKYVVTYEGQHTHAPPNPALGRKSPKQLADSLPDDDGMDGLGFMHPACKEESSQPSSPGRPHMPPLNMMGGSLSGMAPLSALQQVTQMMQQAANYNMFTGMPMGQGMGSLQGLGGLPMPLPLDIPPNELAQVQANALGLGMLPPPGMGGDGGQPSVDAMNHFSLQLMAAAQLARHSNQLQQLGELMLPGQGLNGLSGWECTDSMVTPRMPCGDSPMAAPQPSSTRGSEQDGRELLRSRKRKAQAPAVHVKDEEEDGEATEEAGGHEGEDEDTSAAAHEAATAAEAVSVKAEQG